MQVVKSHFQWYDKYMDDQRTDKGIQNKQAIVKTGCFEVSFIRFILLPYT